MKIGIISDIHGNLTAFQAVLPALADADNVVCLGDVAATGPQPHETIALLKRLGWPCVMGNADESLLKRARENFGQMSGSEEDIRKMRALDRWTRSQITDSDKKHLSTFRPTIEIEVGESVLSCYHGSPRRNRETIFPTTPDEDLVRIFSHRKASIFAGGHTHSQMSLHWRNSLIINPGSVGLPFEKDPSGRARNPAWAEYAVVTLDGGELKVELGRVRYSLSKLSAIVRKSGMQDPDWWLADWF